MKIAVVNGSPRKKCNTAQMLQLFIDGIKEASPLAEIELIHLYDYMYKGCISCFACQMTKNRENPCCQIRDDIYEILRCVRNADGIVFGSPIYFYDITAQLRAFLERLMYPGHTDKAIPTAFIYTMNATEEQKEEFNFEGALSTSKSFLESTFHEKPECVYAFNTFQYNDNEIYNEGFRQYTAMKKENQKIQFPIDLQKAFEAGKSFALKCTNKK